MVPCPLAKFDCFHENHIENLINLENKFRQRFQQSTMSNAESEDNKVSLPREEMEAAREEVMEYEKKIRVVKEALKNVSNDKNTDSKNSLKLSALKVRQTQLRVSIYMCCLRLYKRN